MSRSNQSEERKKRGKERQTSGQEADAVQGNGLGKEAGEPDAQRDMTLQQATGQGTRHGTDAAWRHGRDVPVEGGAGEREAHSKSDSAQQPLQGEADEAKAESALAADFEAGVETQPNAVSEALSVIDSRGKPVLEEGTGRSPGSGEESWDISGMKPWDTAGMEPWAISGKESWDTAGEVVAESGPAMAFESDQEAGRGDRVEPGLEAEPKVYTKGGRCADFEAGSHPDAATKLERPLAAEPKPALDDGTAPVPGAEMDFELDLGGEPGTGIDPEYDVEIEPEFDCGAGPELDPGTRSEPGCEAAPALAFEQDLTLENPASHQQKDALSDELAPPPAPKRGRRGPLSQQDEQRLLTLRRKARALPLLPGVYFMKNAEGKIIYVGKAKALRNRVSSYFVGVDRHTPKVASMVSQVVDFDTIVTANELEALVLECSQIKHYMPHYNILLKDDKNYPYVKVTMGDPYPRVLLTRKRENDGSLYFGPYSGRVKEVVATIQKTFRLPSCSRVFPRDIGKGRPCLNHAIKTCMAPCSGQVPREQYLEAVGEAVAFLEGKQNDLVTTLSQRMEAAADELRFEEAARLRDRLQALQKLEQSQKVVDAPDVQRDVIGLCFDDKNAAVVALTIRNGRLTAADSFLFDKEELMPPETGLSSFLKQHYLQRVDIPREILLTALPDEAELLEQYLTGRAGRRVHLRVPQRGDARRVLELAERNADQSLERVADREEKVRRSVAELAALTGLDTPPRRIEAIDISNTSGSEVVGGIVVFVDGRPSKKDYKRYKIKTVEGQDDYESMREVVWRRLRRFQKGDVGFEQLPDLLLLDGGKGQLSAVKEVLEELGVTLPVFGMVKDDRHRTRGLVGESGEITPRPVSPAFVLLAQIQEEVHRYAISYHRALRGKKTFSSQLAGIKGIGKTRAAALLTELKTLDAIKNATQQELAAVPGMTKPAARAVWQYFHGEVSQNMVGVDQFDKNKYNEE